MTPPWCHFNIICDYSSKEKKGNEPVRL